MIHEGNIQRIIIKDSHGHTVMEVPVTVGVVAFIVAPVLTAVAAMAAAAAEWSIEVERHAQDEQSAAAAAGLTAFSQRAVTRRILARRLATTFSATRSGPLVAENVVDLPVTGDRLDAPGAFVPS